jgi:SAM-dependent methyltransferase
MTDLKQATPVDGDKLMSFVFRCVDEVGATLNTAMVVMGDKLGYYKAMAAGPTTPSRLASDAGTTERYAREWLNQQVAGGIVSYDPASGDYTLPPEQVVAFTDESSPVYLPGFFQLALGSLNATDKIIDASRSGAGFAWTDQSQDVHQGCERFFRPGYNANLLPDWLPALDGVVEKLERGARVADIGCGFGSSTMIMAKAFPKSTFTGSDYHQGSIAAARETAQQTGLTDRVRFEQSPADSYGGAGYDLVTTFDALHDMGDPVGTARHVRSTLAADGTWMVVEPAAGDQLEDNINPVGRAYYGFSNLLCTPGALSQEVGLALGAQAGPSKIRDVVTSAGFTRFRQVAATPFNLVYEIRP